MNDRLLRVTVILSVFALVGVAVAVGGAAAQGLEVEDVEAPFSAPNDAQQTVTATINNTGSSSATDTIEYQTTNGSADGTPTSPFSNTVDSETVTVPGGGTEPVSFSFNTAGLDNASGTTSVDYIQRVIAVNDGANVTQDLTVGTNSSGRVNVEVQDDTLTAQGGVGVSLFDSDKFNSVNDPGPEIRSGTTNSDGKVQFTNLAVGENETESEDYTAVAAADDPEFESGRSQLSLFEPNQDEDGTLITVDRIALPDQFDIDQSSESALGDGEDEIEFNVSILGNLEGERLTNEEFRVFHDGGAAVNIPNGVTFSTGNNGDKIFTVTSNESQRVNFEFVSVENADDGDPIVEFREKAFVLQGEGTVIGDVWNTGSPDLRSLEDVRIWAVQKADVTAQGIRVPPEAATGNVTGNPIPLTDAFNTSGKASFFRVRKTESPDEWTPEEDEILDVTQDYRIDNNGQNFNLSISRVRELNTTDSGVGNGFAVEANVDNPVATNATGAPTGSGMFVTPLEPGYYYIEQSDNQVNASDERFVDDTTGTDEFEPYAVGGLSQFADGGPVAPTVNKSNAPLRRNGNLTFESAQEFSDLSGQQLTDLTDENGEYVLDEMFTDFQAGVDYTIFANKGGFEIEFVDAFVTENGAFFEAGTDENFAMRPINESVEVNVTNLAVVPDEQTARNLGELDNPSAYEAFELENQTDRFSQKVPRDGRSIDVLQVDTQTAASGAPKDETIELSVPDQFADPGTVPDEENFTGRFIEVAGGTVESQDNTNATITINTGDDGQAIVWLQTDLSGSTLGEVPADSVNTGGQVCSTDNAGNEFFSGVIAQSPTDAGIVDATCKEFAGTAVFETAELSGVVTNQNNDPVESTVFLQEIDMGTPASDVADEPAPPGFFFTNHRVEITQTGSNEFAVRQLFDNRTAVNQQLVEEVLIGEETGVTANELRNYQGFATTNFPQIAVAGDATSGVTILTNSDDVTDPGTEDSTYTLPEVPAERPDPITGGGLVDVTPTAIDAQENRGTAVATTVEVDRTSTANIEVSANINFQVDFVDAPSTVNEGDTLDVTANVTNQGGVTAERVIDYGLQDDAGVEVLSDTDTLTLGGGETGTASFSVDTSGLEGNFTNVVTTADDQQGETDDTEIVGAEDEVFTEPLLDEFNAPPQNIPVADGGLDDNLFEDLDGDGDATDLDPTVTVFSAVIRGELTESDLTDEQVDALDWDGDGDFDTSDVVELFSQQIR